MLIEDKDIMNRRKYFENLLTAGKDEFEENITKEDKK